LPLILAPDRSKLSKRHGAVSVMEYKKAGYLPEALINMLAFLGWNPGTDKEIYGLKDLIKDFSIEKIQKGGAIFNIQKLDYLNGFYIRRKSLDDLTNLCLPYLLEAQLITKGRNGGYLILENQEKIPIDYLEKIIAIYKERLKKLSEISELTDFLFKNNLQYDKELLRWKTMGDREVSLVIDKLIKIIMEIKEKNWNRKKLETILLTEAEKTALELNMDKDRGCLLWPLRAALSGKKSSATPFEIAEILGKEKTLKRLETAKNLIIDNI